MKTRSQKFRETHPNYDKEWYANNIEKCRESSRRSYKLHIVKQRMRSLIKNRKSRKDNPEYWKDKGKKYSRTAKGIFNHYKKNAKSRGIVMDLTFEQFEKYIGKKCYYCGQEARGVDRVDNNKGYTKENSVSCCGVCNHMKKNWSEYFFIEHCRLVIKYNRK